MVTIPRRGRASAMQHDYEPAPRVRAMLHHGPVRHGSLIVLLHTPSPPPWFPAPSIPTARGKLVQCRTTSASGKKADGVRYLLCPFHMLQFLAVAWEMAWRRNHCERIPERQTRPRHGCRCADGEDLFYPACLNDTGTPSQWLTRERSSERMLNVCSDF